MCIRDSKYVLLDFWASWCGPCMGEVPHLKKTYGDFHKKGFEIFGVSFDEDRGDWLGAVEQNGMDWLHVSEDVYKRQTSSRAPRKSPKPGVSFESRPRPPSPPKENSDVPPKSSQRTSNPSSGAKYPWPQRAKSVSGHPRPSPPRNTPLP